MLLKGKVTIITGAAAGIKQAGACLFAHEGAKVVIADINDQAGEETVNEIKRQGNEATFVHADVGSVSDIERMIRAATATYGRLDILWHNAGLFIEGHIELTTEEDFDKQIAISLKAAVFATKFAIPEMRRAGGGSVLYTSSMVGLRPTPYRPSYSLTHGLAKAGLVILVRCLTEPLARDNIRVNCICPGPVPTPGRNESFARMVDKEGVRLEEFLKGMTARIPLGRQITTEEVANAALFLVSDRASGITGVALPVDGGFAAV